LVRDGQVGLEDDLVVGLCLRVHINLRICLRQSTSLLLSKLSRLGRGGRLGRIGGGSCRGCSVRARLEAIARSEASAASTHMVLCASVRLLVLVRLFADFVLLRGIFGRSRLLVWHSSVRLLALRRAQCQFRLSRLIVGTNHFLSLLLEVSLSLHRDVWFRVIFNSNNFNLGLGNFWNLDKDGFGNLLFDLLFGCEGVGAA